jgi:hypothetical protein
MYEVGTKVRLDLPAEVLDALQQSPDDATHTVVGHDGQYLVIKPIRLLAYVPARESRIAPDRVVVMDAVDGSCEEIEHDDSCPVSKGYVRVCTCKRESEIERRDRKVTGGNIPNPAVFGDPTREAAQDDPRGERDR